MVICEKCGYEVTKDKADKDNLLDACKAVRDGAGGYVFDRDEMPDDENPVIISPATWLMKQVVKAIALAEK